MVLLHSDLLYIIADKLLLEDTERNLINSTAFKFMLLNRTCKNSLLSHFAKIKFFDFYGTTENVEVQMYKSKSFYFNKKKEDEYQGPFIADKNFVALLLQNGKFRAREITFNNVLTSTEYNTELSNTEDVKGPLIAFLALLGLQDIMLETNFFLSLDLVKVMEASKFLVNLDKYLMLDAKQMEFEFKIDELNCLPFDPSNLQIFQSSHVESIDFNFISSWISEDQNPHYLDKWHKLLEYVLSTCSNLKKLKISLAFETIADNSALEFLTKFHGILMTFHEEIIPRILQMKKSFEPVVTIELRTFISTDFLEELPALNHSLLKFGDEKILEDELEKCRQKIYLHGDIPGKESVRLDFYIFSSDDPDTYENDDAFYDIFDHDDPETYSDYDYELDYDAMDDEFDLDEFEDY